MSSSRKFLVFALDFHLCNGRDKWSLFFPQQIVVTSIIIWKWHMSIFVNILSFNVKAQYFFSRWDYNNELFVHQSIGLTHLAFHIVTINGFHLVPHFKLVSFQKYWPVFYWGMKRVIHLVIMKPIFMFICGNFLMNFRSSGLRISRGRVNFSHHFFLSLFSWAYINV